MQQIEAVIHPIKLSEVRDVLQELGVGDFMESPVLCHTDLDRQPMSFRGAKFVTHNIEKVKLEVVAADEAVEKITAAIGAIAKTGSRDDCRIAVRPYLEVI